MTDKCPQCTGPHTLDHCPNWRIRPEMRGMVDSLTPSTKIVIGDGTFTIHHEAGLNLRCLRNGQYWLDMVGDRLALIMVQDIVSLREEVEMLRSQILGFGLTE